MHKVTKKIRLKLFCYIAHCLQPQPTSAQAPAGSEQAGPRHLRQEEISTPNTEQHEDELGKAALHLQQGTAGCHCRDTKNPLIARLSIQVNIELLGL